MSEPRRWTGEHPDGGRLDENGVEWLACDPYPTWFRWEDGELILPEYGLKWADKRDNYALPPVTCPKCGAEERVKWSGVECSSPDCDWWFCY